MEKVKVKILKTGINYPKYMTDGAAGLDIFANVEEPIVVFSGKSAVIPTGVFVELPKGYEFNVRPRSGIMFTKDVIGGFGTIDADYRGEIKVKLFNLGKNQFVVNAGDRIAQLVLQKVYHCEFEEVEALEETIRGTGGFGHTGK